MPTQAMAWKFCVPSSNLLAGRLYVAARAQPHVELVEAEELARHRHRPAAPVDLLQQPRRRVAHQQRADARRKPEHLVERQRHEVGVHRGQVQRVRRNEGRRVQRHQPLRTLRSNAAKSKTSPKKPFCTASIHDSGYFTPAKLSSAGNANRLNVWFGLNDDGGASGAGTSIVALDGRSSSLTARKPPP